MVTVPAPPAAVTDGVSVRRLTAQRVVDVGAVIVFDDDPPHPVRAASAVRTRPMTLVPRSVRLSPVAHNRLGRCRGREGVDMAHDETLRITPESGRPREALASPTPARSAGRQSPGS